MRTPSASSARAAYAVALTITCLYLSTVAACGGMRSSGSPSSESASSTGGETSDSITNVQEQGVDEGGIVKMHGEHLVVLRRGRLFSVDLSGGGMRTLSVADAYAPGHRPADWYDEMLIHGDTIVVIGFSYRDRATEIELFGIDAAGAIAHRGAFQLRSNDYYSSRNYASRLIGDQLVIYVPHELGRAHDTHRGRRLWDLSFPALRAVGGDWIEIEGPVHADLESSSAEGVLHTVVMCDLGGDRNALGCRAQGMIGPRGRSFYVSRDAVYVWISDRSSGDGSADARPTDAMVYRLPLDGGPTGAVRAWGAPTDQLSFSEGDDGMLHVLVRAQGDGDGMWSPEIGRGDLALASLPLTSFGAEGRAVAPATYRVLPKPGDGALQNRFVGDWVLYGSGDTWGWGGDHRGGGLYAHSWRHGGPAYRVDVSHGVERIEAMGRAAVAIGRRNGDLHFSSVALAGGPQLVDRYVLSGASQGETRTHGFFYRDDGEGQGMLGLPVRGGGAGWHQLQHGSASVFYLRVSGQRFTPLGGLDASGAGEMNDGCVASCTDWYGNARPIFWRGRIFALLGYEVVEGRMSVDRVVEVNRLVLRPEGARASLRM